MSNLDYCLVWDNHATNLSSNFSKLYENQEHLDIILNCENQNIGVHKCILTASSLYFREQLQKNSGTAYICFRKISLNVLKLLVEFMYKGHVYVRETDLNSVLIAAKFFKITGLSGLNSEFKIPDDFCLNQIDEPEFIPKSTHTYLDKEVQTNNLDVENINCGYEGNISKNEEIEFLHQNAKNKKENYSQIPIVPVNTSNKSVCSSIEQNAFYKNPTGSELLTHASNESSCTNSFVNQSSYNEQLSNGEYLEECIEPFQNTEYHNNPNTFSEVSNYSLPVETKRKHHESDKAIQVLQNAGIPTDVPIYFEGNDGKYVELTKDILEEIASGGQVVYQVVDEDGKAGELLLGSTVRKTKELSKNFKDLDSLSNNVYDIVTNALNTSSPTLSIKTIEKTLLTNSTDYLINKKNKLLHTNFKNNDPNLNTCLNSKVPPISESNQIHLKTNNDNYASSPIQTNIKIEVDNNYNSNSDLIVQNIDEYRNESRYLNDNFISNGEAIIDTVNETLNEEDITRILNNEQDCTNVLKLMSSRTFDKTNVESQTVNELEKSNRVRKENTISETSDGSIKSASKEIPYALGLLPLRKALKKIQNMTDHASRKTRSNHIKMCKEYEIKAVNNDVCLENLNKRRKTTGNELL